MFESMVIEYFEYIVIFILFVVLMCWNIIDDPDRKKFTDADGDQYIFRKAIPGQFTCLICDLYLLPGDCGKAFTHGPAADKVCKRGGFFKLVIKGRR